MKKKITAIFIIFMMFFTNYVFADGESYSGGLVDNFVVGEVTLSTDSYSYSETNPPDISYTANLLDDNVYISDEYKAYSLKVKCKDISIYDYNTNNAKTLSSSEVELTDSNKKYYYTYYDTTDIQIIYCSFKLGEDSLIERTNVATILYKNAIEYNNNKYSLKANIKSIKKSGTDKEIIRFKIGERANSSNNVNDLSTYTNGFYPTLGATGGTNHTEIGVDWYIVDDKGDEISVSGLLGITDIDLNQGLYLKDFVANRENTYSIGTGEKIYNSNGTNYDIIGNGTVGLEIKKNKDTYVKALTDEDNNGKNVYLLLKDRSNLCTTFLFNNKTAYSNFIFTKSGINRYKRITTSVTGGTITPTITEIKNGENKTVEYTPTNANLQYLQSIKVDGEDVALDTYKDKYEFSNIENDHTIDVVYGNKLKVTYDAKGGTPTPDTEYVLPKGKATSPTTVPTKNGYTFGGWKKTGETTTYDYNKEVTEDINLEAIWTPIVYNINYVLNGGTNDSKNPSTYTIEDTVNFQPATREGYDFLGWYEDENFNTKIDSISNRTGDITVYAKWKEKTKTNVAYKVEHYKETTDGKYELAVTDSLTGEANQSVTATAKDFTGFYEDTTNSERVNTGTIKEDGSLTLKLYYNKNKYTVTFEPKNNTKIDSQTVKYQDKATEPEKPTMTGYTFKYWYYKNANGDEVQYNFDDPVTSNIDLIAKWEEVKVIVKNISAKNTKKTETTTTASSNSIKSLPKTGTISLVSLIALAGVALVVFGIRYNKYKDI